MKDVVLLCFTLITLTSFSQSIDLIGVTSQGGIYNNGAIFKTDLNGDNIEHVNSLNGNIINNKGDGGLVQTATGEIYGFTNRISFTQNTTTLYKYDTITKQITNLIEFNLSEGQNQQGSLIQAVNGNIYGTMVSGGGSNSGVLFEFNPIDESYVVLVNFGGTNNGVNPYSGVIQGQNGNLYGTTRFGGQNNNGTLFEYSLITNTISYIHHFDSPISGTSPSKITQASNGNIYGTTTGGGVNNKGVFFEYNLANSQFTKHFDFDDTEFGYPKDITEEVNGKIYGTSSSGLNNYGAIFEFNISTGLLVKKLDFDGSYGRIPESIVYHENNEFYGLNQLDIINGPTFDSDIIFKYNSTSNSCSFIHRLNFFESFVCDLNEIIISDNNIIGQGGTGGDQLLGGVFEFNINTNTYNTLANFHHENNGSSPTGGICNIENSQYILCSSGGQNSEGSLIELSNLNAYVSKKINFQSLNNGSYPVGKLIHYGDKLYGMTENGGSNNKGVIFEYDLQSSQINVLFNFNGSQGAIPKAGLIVYNGHLYGMTSEGGVNNQGVIFKYNINTSNYIKLFDFDGVINGSSPFGGLTLYNNNLYGFASQGGTNNLGVIFELNTSSDTYVKLYDFLSVAQGSKPVGEINIDENGIGYGTTLIGGSNNQGSFFSFNLNNNTYSYLNGFDSLNTGMHPTGYLLKASNGNYYGLTTEGGINNSGVIFEYVISNNLLNKKYDFKNDYIGRYPTGGLVEVINCPNNNIIIDSMVCYGSDYLLPNGTLLSNINQDTLHTYTTTTQFGCDSTITTQLIVIPTTLSETYSICSGQSYTFPDGTTQTNITTGFDYISNLTSMLTGCDSIITTTINVIDIDNTITQNGIDIVASETNADIFNLLECNGNLIWYNAPPEIFGLLPGDYVFEILKNGCVDTTDCITITNQDYYDLPDYTILSAEAFAFPVTTLDSCDGLALGFGNGGIPPYYFDWYTQANNENTNELDSICEGFHTLKIYDMLGDSASVDYFVTDTTNWYDWFDNNATFVDTIYIADENCVLDMNAPLDDSYISDFYYLYSGNGLNEDYYYLEITYSQAGSYYTISDTVLMELNGMYLIDFSIYCPSKASNRIKTVVTALDYPTILNVGLEKDLLKVVLFPNPSSHEVTVNLGEANTNTTITMSDLGGKVVYNQNNINSKNHKFNIENLESGVYFVNINSNGKQKTIKFIKQW